MLRAESRAFHLGIWYRYKRIEGPEKALVEASADDIPSVGTTGLSLSLRSLASYWDAFIMSAQSLIHLSSHYALGRKFFRKPDDIGAILKGAALGLS